MKRKTSFVLCSLLMTTLLFGCGEHEHQWEEATCTSPKTCTVCDIEKGDPLEHQWEKATCISPKTCTVCNESIGEPLDHDSSNVTCITDAPCIRCGEILSAPGHSFVDATCTNAKKCSTCGTTEGQPLGHTTTNGICSRCSYEIYEEISGKGDDVISNITTGTGIYRMHLTHSGRRNFAIWQYDANGGRELLVNEIGNYNGYVLLSGSAPYTLEITADGMWTYQIEKLSASNESSFMGKGDFVTPIISLESQTYQFTHNGKSNFAVWVYSENGRDLLVNEIGNYNGKRIINFSSDSNVFFEVTADGDWSITPQ